MNKITVVVPAKIRTLREAEWLKIALASVPKNVPVILIDDHSLVDWTEVQAVCKFGKQVKVKHMPEDKTGLAAARNLASSLVKTDFFFALDADDYLAPDALQIALDNYPGDGFLYGSTILFDDRQRTTYKARPYDICKLLEAVYWPNGCLQKTENARKIGWDESLLLYEDWDYWLRSAKAGIIGHHIPDVLYCYRQNPNGIIQTLKRSPDMVKRAREAIEIRHADLFSGKNPMACCGQKNTKAKTNTIPPARDLSIPAPAADGMVLISFLGGGLTRSFYGASGICYRFGGSRRKYGYVAQEDLPGLLAMKEGSKYLFITESKQ